MCYKDGYRSIFLFCLTFVRRNRKNTLKKESYFKLIIGIENTVEGLNSLVNYHVLIMNSRSKENIRTLLIPKM